MDKSITEFASLLKENTYKPIPHVADLHNIVFFVGSGFSKGWSQNYPLSSELFNFSLDKTSGPEAELRNLLSSASFGDRDHLEFKDLKELSFRLQAYQKYPHIRPRYLDNQNIAYGESLLKAKIYTELMLKIPNEDLFDPNSTKFVIDQMDKSKQSYLDFFRYLKKLQTGDQLIPEGIRYHFLTTNYDACVETILDNIIGPDDSLFLYTYRGLSPKSISGIANPQPLHDHFLADVLLKINGGFEIIRDKSGTYNFDYNARTFEDIVLNPPEIILPSNEQPYSNPYFDQIFPKTIRLLQEANTLVLVGYSLPEEDVLIRFILRHFAEDVSDLVKKKIFYIDPTEENVLRDKLSSVFPFINYSNKLGDFVHVSNSKFADWASAVLDQTKNP